ncbi:DUF6491 family protein [Aquisalinus flavus]|uniref:Uncharacterized protein n=1 Tax=Aquisalinus flavus TaxID=1526572 RepID=A0A8J2V4P6_9PROT|nr:DUF6491 family protein [Aquisalinus flavus]MBD0426018.1 hypothetical protein [Aquisalinus flavus]UNE48390.1 hypothetical protein FF099_10190 [Aquisalinus flavus]GGD11378.1 hypothetical protein GCM10011342_20220 [Aquisalinus flavus]
MSFMNHGTLGALLGVCVLTACSSTPEQAAERAQAQAVVSAEINARQGKAVGQICPRGSDGWRMLGDDAVLLEARGEWYMAELSGMCNPASAFAGLATRSGTGSSCLARGDKLLTGSPRSGEVCVITGLYDWDEAAEVAASTSTGVAND